MYAVIVTGGKQYRVMSGETLRVEKLDFDVGKAFIPPQEINPSSTDSGFIFSPVIRAADSRRTGAITGTVRALSATGAPVADAALRLYLGNPGTPENTWIVLQTGKTAADGSFRLSYVTRSTYWAGMAAQAGKSYIVAVDPPPATVSFRVARVLR